MCIRSEIIPIMKSESSRVIAIRAIVIYLIRFSETTMKKLVIGFGSKRVSDWNAKFNELLGAELLKYSINASSESPGEELYKALVVRSKLMTRRSLFASY
jgi:hypothetical protein